MVKSELHMIEVAYATRERQALLSLEVSSGTTLEAAILQSGILERFPEIDLKSQAVGVFSERRSLKSEVKEGERIEIYRPILCDPKESRRLRAKLAKLKAKIKRP